MSKRNSLSTRREIREEASAWFVELNENPQDRMIRETFNHWLRRSPEHVEAFLRISTHWEESTPGSGTPIESVDQLIALGKTDKNVVQLTSQGRAPTALEATYRNRRSYRRLALAASLVLGIICGGLVWQQFFRGIYTTGVGEQRSITFADGSTAELNSRSRIRVRYTVNERHIDLLEGQAIFHATKNELRPFIVQSGDTRVRAVGTHFDVYRKKDSTVVTVVEGRVAVTSVVASGAEPETSAGARGTSQAVEVRPAVRQPDVRTAPITLSGDVVFVGAGDQITVGSGPVTGRALTHLDPANIEAATAWTHHRLVFKAAQLSQVVSEFNRYSERRIIITDPEIAATRISGSFSSSDPRDLLRFLREVGAYDVRETSAAISISRR